ncbi:Hypothetical predicted protein [Cloeon dipterum]|uniref:tRNA-uridine aminocarboxypropyltransferase 1 n=1 Tax=Cloeon dipterum TaxID=197152 RepID=A0A8S1CAY4_9INSE|nr:Hypothetical predicted protein [Cloeon dipterum]
MEVSTEVDANPFGKYIISDWHFLESMDGRSTCPKCGKSRKYFCYTCYVPIKDLEGKLPVLNLPIKVDIIKHAKEIDGKSTSAHAALLAPNDVSIYIFPCIPDYDDKSENIVLVFPGKDAISIEEFVSRQSAAKVGASKKRPYSSDKPIDRAIFIDSTWNQCKGIFKDSRLRDLPCVVLKQRITQFWRHQEGSPRWYLATVEAVHQLLVELDLAIKSHSADPESKKTRIEGEANQKDDILSHEFDDLLFFFKFMYEKIHTLYDHNQLKSYKRPLK